MAFERMAYLEAVVGADITQFRKGMRDIRNEVGILSESMGGLAGLGRTLTYTVTAPVMAFGSMAVQQASEFDAAMRNINSIVGLSEDQFAALSQQVLDFGKTTRGGVTESANALYTVFSAGILDTAEAFNIMEASVRTAEAGLADLETTTSAIVATQLAFNDTSGEMTTRVSDALTRMVQVGVGSMDEFAHAIAQVSPSASMLGMSIEELFGDMAFLTQRGQSAANAATNLNNALTSLAKPTEAMQAAMQELGVVGAEELIEKFGGVNGAFQALIGTTNGTQQEIQALFNNIRGARAINVFAQDIEGWNATMAEFNASLDGSTMRAWEEQGKSFASHWDLLQSSLGAAAITIGNALIPVLIPLIDGITQLVIGFTELDPTIIQTGIVITGMIAAAAPIMWLIGGIVPAIMGLGAALGALSGGAILAGTALITVFSGIAVAASQYIEPLLSMFTGVTDVIEDLGTPITMETPAVELTGEPTVIDPMSIITVDTTKSLWQIFTEQGYDDYFSWQEFMRLAEEGGWNGGAVEVGTEITIDMTGVRTLPPPMPLVTITGDYVETDTASIEDSITTDFTDTWNAIDWQSMWDDLEFDYAASGFGDLVTGIQTFADEVGAADWSGLADLSTEMIKIGNILIGGVASGIGDILAGVGGGIGGIVDAVDRLLEGDFDGAMQSLVDGLVKLGSGTILGVADLVAGIVDALAELFNLDIPDFTEFVDQMRAEFATATASLDTEPVSVQTTLSPDFAWTIDPESQMDEILSGQTSTLLGDTAIAAQRDWLTNNITGYTLTVTVPADINWQPEAVDVVLDAAEMATNMDLTEAERAAAQALLDSWGNAMSPEDKAAFEQILAAYYAGGGIVVTPEGFTIQVNADGSYVVIDPLPTEAEVPADTTISVDAGYAMAVANGWIVEPPDGTVPLSTEEPLVVDAPVEVETADIAANFSNAFAEGMDGATIVATYLQPIEDKWNAMFAPEGTMTVNLSTFVENMTTQAVAIDDQAFLIETTFSDMASAVEVAMNRVMNSVNNTINGLEGRMGGAVQGVLKLQSVISNLMNMEGIMEIYLNIGSTGVSTDGSHAKGLSNVPFDGYIAELHAGEGVLTKEENQQYKYDQMNAGVLMGSTSSPSVTNNNQQINVQTAFTFDDFIAEAQRRGYELVRR